MARHSILLASALAASLLACEYTTPGTRAGYDYCPEGEDCSPATPQGLYFTGAHYSDCILFCSGQIKVTATGGTQTITVYEDEAATERLDLPFAAVIEGDSFAVNEVAGPEVTLGALAPDWSLLRIVEPDTDELYDRVPVEAKPLDYVLGMPAQPLELFLVEEQDPWAIWAPHSALVIGLHDENGHRLTDESMQIALETDAAGALERDRWDRVLLSGLEPGPVTLRVTAGGWAELPIEVNAVDSIDRIEHIDEIWDDPAEPMPVGRRPSYCFRGLNQDVPVTGLDWSFSSPDAELEPLFSNCIGVWRETPGVVALTISAGGMSLTVEITIVEEEPSAGQAPDLESWTRRRPAPGERAAAL